MTDSQKFDRYYGTIVGAAVGDAAGASLEFYRHGTITRSVARNAMKMLGGGSLRIGPGQVTDDFELTRTLSNALALKNPNMSFPIDDIATGYIDWYNSHPFDIGRTCAKAFNSYTSYDVANGLTISEHMMNTALNLNIDSQANGALMRCSPIALWCRKLSVDQAMEYARQDAMLSHPNKVCQDANAVFTLTLHHLINHPGDALGALRMAEEYVTNVTDESPIAQQVHDWVLVESKWPIDAISCDCNIGWVRHAFVLAMHCLRNYEYGFEKAIELTLMKGGDTDTNASIVGALLGGLYGEPEIPLYMKNPVMLYRADQWTPNQLGYFRPSQYGTFNSLKVVDKVLGMDDTFNNGFRNTKTYYDDHYLF